MKHLVILGGGTAGTIIANQLARGLATPDWRIVVVDRDNDHLFQPGFLFVPFHGCETDELVRSRRHHLDRRVDFIESEVTRVEPDRNTVHLANGDSLPYDFLVLATGAQPAPARDPGTLGPEWHGQVGEFYTLEGCTRLQRQLDLWRGGRLVVSAAPAPIKNPVAPLEFVFLADTYFRQLRMRPGVELEYVTPLPHIFSQPKAAELFADLAAQRRIHVTANFAPARIDQAAKKLVSADGREIGYDLLVTVPTTTGAAFLGASGLGDDLNFVPTDRQTLLVKNHVNIFALGDATDLPVAKTASVARFQADVLYANLLALIAGRAPESKFDGHANYFVESGDGKAVLVDLNYEVEPLPGKFPLPTVGPLSLLKETRLNHWGNLALRLGYWHVLLTGRPLPLPTHFSLAGKDAAA